MTLTGRIDAERRESTVTLLRDAFQRRCAGPITVDLLALMKQDTPASAFRVLNTTALR